MDLFEETSLWSRTLAKQNESERTETARERLRSAFLGFRRRASQLADEIPQNMRLMTVHDVSHLDALWEIADIVAGEDYDVNPAEAFVLGGAILLHDLGMSLSSYSSGIADLKKHPSWPDITFNILQKSLKRAPTEKELAALSSDIEDEAANIILRNLHAKHAADLARIGFSQKDNDAFYLLEDVELRTQIGGLIGEIAYSHWWPIEQVAKRFATKIGSFVFAPKAWTIDPLKIACLLRCADACHLDGRRAPSFLMALRKPTGVSELHWTFQERLQKPTVENNRFVFTTSRPFLPSEHQAWWLCFETLQQADRELRQSNMALADLGRPHFDVQGVAGIDSTDRLVRYIPTEGWEPVDINVRVGDVPGLVKKLGGSSLYGQNPIVPLRELIQNGCDAVRARRIFEDRAPTWGQVSISAQETGSSEVVTVSDIGVGMSRAVLTGPLLDFGESYWNSRLAQDHLPGLARKGFNATGGFGIGFYSTFMWGDDVKVVTRSRDASPSETLVLHFQKGLEARPILRPAEYAEQRSEPGTSVSVILTRTTIAEISSAMAEYSESYYYRDDDLTIGELCAWISPASDVDLLVEEPDVGTRLVVQGGDWNDLTPKALLSRLFPNVPISKKTSKILDKRMRPISRNGEIIARLAISADLAEEPGAVTTAGILRSSTETADITGLALGIASTASRMASSTLLTTDELREWATTQRDLIGTSLEPRASQQIARVIRRCGADTDHLIIAEGAAGFLTFSDIAQGNWPDEMLIVFSTTVERTRAIVPEAKLLPNCLSVDLSGLGHGFPDSWHLQKSNSSRWHVWHDTLTGSVLEALALAWEKPLDDLLVQIDMESQHRVERVWGEGIEGRKLADRLVYFVAKKAKPKAQRKKSRSVNAAES